MNDRYSEYHLSVEELDRLVERLGIDKNFHDLVLPKLDSVSKTFRDLFVLESHLSERLLSPKPLELQTKRLFSTQSFLSSLEDKQQVRLENYKTKFSLGLIQQESTLIKLIEKNSLPSTNQIRLEVCKAYTAWEGGLTKLLTKFQQTNLLQTQLELTKRLLEPSRVYTNFVDKTAQRIELASHQNVVKALTTSLHLVETQLLSTTKILSYFTTDIDDSDKNVSSPKTLNLFDVQQEELISSFESVEVDEQLDLVYQTFEK